MAVLTCPRCGGTKKDPKTGNPCEFCGGSGKVKVNEKELEKEVKREKTGN